MSSALHPLLRVAFSIGLAVGLACTEALAAESDELVQLNLGPEIELRVLVDLISREVGVKVLYDETIANKKLSLRAPEQLPRSSLLDVLRSALRMKGFLLAEADAPGWLRIDKADKLSQLSRLPSDNPSPGEPVTQAFRLRHADPKRVDQVIRPFLQQPGANSVALDEQGLLIVTDYAASLERIGEWVRLADQPGQTAKIEIYRVRHVEAGALAEQLTTVLEASSRVGDKQQSADNGSVLEVVPDERTNQVLLVGSEEAVVRARDLADELDVPLGVQTEVYQIRHVEAARVDSLVEKLLDPLDAKRLYRSAVDEDGNQFIVTTTDAIHRRISETIESIDRPLEATDSPIKFYKLKHVTADEMLATLQAIRGQTTTTTEIDAVLPGSIRGVSGLPNSRGPNRLPSYPGQPNPTPVFTESTPVVVGATATPEGFEGPSQQDADLLAEAQTAADPLTNSIIVIAKPEVQRLYAELIERLDQRRPQVLIEAKIVTLDVTDNYSLGIELSGGDRTEITKLFAFTSFGLSTVNPATGALTLLPGTGLNGALLDSDDADAILRALATHGRARVSAAPRVLVNDNATGTLTSVAEVPFTSVNASNTVATTSFAGYAEAGTTISATPHISDDNYLQLDYVITLNSFTGTGGDGVPPPRQTDEIESAITIPNGSTVVVGGLNRSANSRDTSGIPIIENLPLGQWLGGTETKAHASSALFVFIKPVILREDKFRDLKNLTKRPRRRSGIRSDAPVTQACWMAPGE